MPIANPPDDETPGPADDSPALAASPAPEPGPLAASPAPDPMAEAIKANRAFWVNRIRAMGGRTMPDTSNDKVEYFVIPSGHTSFAQVIADIREVSADAATDSLAPENGQTGEPGTGNRAAWIAKLARGDAEAIPTPVRMIPRPIGQILVGAERHFLVLTRDDVATIITPDQVDRNTWLTKSGGKAATTFRMKDITAEAFRQLADLTPVIRTEPRLDTRGRISLLPRGVMPPGWRDIAPNSDREMALAKWKQAAGIVEQSPGGIAAHIWGAALAAWFTRVNRRQSHAIDVFGAETHTGKSTLIKSIGAMIGVPDQVALPCDLASAISATSLTGNISYGFVLFDETQLFDGDKDSRARTVFRVCESGRRTRSKQDGSGVAESKPFGGLMLLTGNLRFVAAETVDKIYPGLSRRYLPFYVDRDKPVFRNDADATAVADLTNSAYGWLIPLVLESVTNDEFMAWDAEIRQDLYGQFPGENSEVLKLFAFHLAGCRAIDRLFGTSLEIAARISVDSQAGIAMHVKADVGELFIDSIRDHVQTNSGKWLTADEYVSFQDRSRLDDIKGTDREPVGIRADDYFIVLGQPMLHKLCQEFGIADPDAVITALDRKGLLKIADSERQRGKSTTITWIPAPDSPKKRISANGYRVLAAPVHGEPDGGQGADTTGPAPVAPESGPESGPQIDPFAGREGGQVATEPATAYTRPTWIPAPLKRDGKGQFSGVVSAFNTLWDRQQIKGRAQIHNHPYPHDDDIPEPLRLIGRNQGTGVHEGSHNYTAIGIAAGTPVTILDRNAAFLAAIGTAMLPIDGLQYTDGEGDSKQVGIYRVESWPQMTADGPHPWGVRKSALAGSELWVTKPTLELGREMAAAGIMAEPRVIGSYVGRVLKPGKPSATRIEWLYGQLRDARAAAITAKDTTGEGFIKAVYSVGISTMGESGSNNRIWRPELAAIIRATAFANHYRLTHKFSAAGLAIVAAKNNDEIHIGATPDTIFAAGIIGRGRGLNEIKVKGGYVMGANGSPEPDSEWSNDHA